MNSENSKKNFKTNKKTEEKSNGFKSKLNYCFQGVGNEIKNVFDKAKPLSKYKDGIKSTITYLKNPEGRIIAIKSASRTIGAIGGGIGGFFIGGPYGGFAGAVTGAQVVDGLTTGIESMVHKKYKPNGFLIEGITDIVKGKSESITVDIVNMSFKITADGFVGLSIAERVSKVSRKCKRKCK